MRRLYIRWLENESRHWAPFTQNHEFYIWSKNKHWSISRNWYH